MTVLHTITQGLEFRNLTTPHQFAAEATDLTYVSLVEARRAVLGIQNQSLAANATVAVIEAKDSGGTDAQAISGLSGTLTDGTDDGLMALFEVLDGDLSDGYTHVTLRVTPGATDTFAAFALLGALNERPASNLVADGVAFVDKLAT